MPEKYDFKYTLSISGSISGPSLMKQTEDAINDLGQQTVENKENTETSVSPTETVSKTALVKAQPAKAKEGLTFSTYTYSEKKHIDNNTELPCCSIDINLSYPTGGNTVKTSLNQLQRIFVAALPEGMQESDSPRTAAERFVKNYIAEYQADIKPYLKKRRHREEAWMNYEMSVQSKNLYNAHSFWGFSVEIYTYTGGAHGIYMSTFLNLDLKTLSPIHLGDLFEGDYKEALTDLLWKQLMADNNVSTRQELEDMGYATTGDLEPIENFYLDPTGITFYYNVYEIAPYVMGATKITLSYEDITHLMNSEFVTLSNTIKAGDQ